MIELKSKLRKWGNSLGVVVPQNFIETEKAKEFLNTIVKPFIKIMEELDV